MENIILQSYNWVDGVIVIILLFGAWRGFHNGFVKTLISLLGSVVGFICAIFYYPTVAAWFNSNWHLNQKIVDYIAPKISIPTMSLSEANPIAYLMKQLATLNLPQSILDQLQKAIESMGTINLQSMSSNLGELVATMLANLLISALAFLSIVLAINLAANLLLFLLRNVLKVAGGTSDKVSGLLVGLLQSFAVLVGIIAVILPILSSSSQSGLTTAVTESFLANKMMGFFYYLTSLF
ncbi:MAG TPA: CvpA family protein [Bacillota bacterium]|nr:CvpA family protein [Bacillota bacterium]